MQVNNSALKNTRNQIIIYMYRIRMLSLRLKPAPH
jgi:hypothetical protein